MDRAERLLGFVKDTILACHEFMGETVLKVVPLVKHRNEMIQQYLKVNWQNIVTVKNKIPEIKEFVDLAENLLKNHAAQATPGGT